MIYHAGDSEFLGGQTDPVGQVWVFTYDLVFKQLLSRTGPLGNVMSYTYDTNGNLTSLTDLLDHTTSLVYNI